MESTATGASASPSRTYTTELELREEPGAIWQWRLPDPSTLTNFDREPAWGQGKVFRGRLRLTESTNQPIPFAWAPEQRKLYLDLNRNRDLTDDANGVWTSLTNGMRQVFTDVKLGMDTPEGVRPVLLDLVFQTFGNSGRVMVDAALRSYWQAKLVLGDKEWQVGLVENLGDRAYPHPPGWWLFRPWNAQGERLSMLGSGSPDLVDYTRRVFLGGRGYEVYCHFRTNNETPHYRMELTEQQPRLGELRVDAGPSLHRVILAEPNGYAVVLDNPAGSIKVPLGTYRTEELWVRKGPVQAIHNAGTELKVDGQSTARLVAGGPLTNMVSAARRGKNLELRYELLGAGGKNFRLDQKDGAEPPRFVIQQGAKKLAAGKFAFG